VEHGVKISQSSSLLRGVEKAIFPQEILRLNSPEDNWEICLRGLNSLHQLLQDILFRQGRIHA
jgi:hypothetical protein